MIVYKREGFWKKNKNENRKESAPLVSADFFYLQYVSSLSQQEREVQPHPPRLVRTGAFPLVQDRRDECEIREHEAEEIY